jgi:homoserine dehydrogenase
MQSRVPVPAVPSVVSEPAVSRATVVLKLGSSVLRGETDLPAVVRAIAAERARGRGVVAVVSAFAGATDRLLARARRLCAGAPAGPVARLLATAEARAAATLALALEGAGVSAQLLEPREVGLLAGGPPLEAEPLALEPRPLRQALARGCVVVLPGFYAQDAAGETVLLGRGGTDLSALFVAARLGAAECRLLKDTGGVFEADPKRVRGARRYDSLSWADARRLGGRVVQDRALALAWREGRGFVVAALDGGRHTRIGPFSTRLAPEPPPAVAGLIRRAPASRAQPELAISATAATSRATSSGVV